MLVGTNQEGRHKPSRRQVLPGLFSGKPVILSQPVNKVGPRLTGPVVIDSYQLSLFVATSSEML
jgi:hypothetical protein